MKMSRVSFASRDLWVRTGPLITSAELASRCSVGTLYSYRSAFPGIGGELALGPYQDPINLRDAGLLGFVLGGSGVSAMRVVEIAV